MGHVSCLLCFLKLVAGVVASSMTLPIFKADPTEFFVALTASPVIASLILLNDLGTTRAGLSVCYDPSHVLSL